MLWLLDIINLFTKLSSKFISLTRTILLILSVVGVIVGIILYFVLDEGKNDKLP